MKKSFKLYITVLFLISILVSTKSIYAQTPPNPEENPAATNGSQTLATPEEMADGIRITEDVISRSKERRELYKNNSIEKLELPDDIYQSQESKEYNLTGPKIVIRNTTQSFYLQPYAQEGFYWYVSSKDISIIDYYDDLIVLRIEGADPELTIKIFDKEDYLKASFTVEISDSDQEFSPGKLITGDQSFLKNQPFSNIEYTEPTGGNCLNNYSYLWQKTKDLESEFTFISGYNGDYLNITQLVEMMNSQDISSMYFRRVVICGNDTLFGGPAGVFILPDLTSDRIQDSIVYAIRGQVNGVIKAPEPVGGNCNREYAYQWEYSYNNITFFSISGATKDSLIIDNSLDQNIYFRRKVQCVDQVAYSNSVRVLLTDPTLRPVATTPAGTPPVITARSLPQAYATEPISFLRVLAPTIPIQDSGAVNIGLPPESLAVTTTYQDSYGRPVQTVTRQQSPDKKDLVAPATFDEFGRPVIQYMPFISVSGNREDGRFKLNAFEQDSIFYKQLFPHEKVIYAEKQFDGSPLNIPVKELAPGNSWGGSGRGVDYFFRANEPDDSVRRWTIVINNEDDVPVSPGYYQPGTLQVTSVKDESRNWVMKFTDDQGRTVMTKTLLRNRIKYGAKGWLVTYYVYDEMGLLRTVIPPKASEILCSSAANWNMGFQNTFENLCFSYYYDDWGRAIMKRIPGKGKSYIAYDQLGRVVMTQDPKLRASQQWAFVKYDKMSRPVKSGLITSSLTKDQIISQASVSNDYPSLSGDFTITSETFYDNYDWISAQSAPFGSTIDSSEISSERFITNYNTAPHYAQPVRSSKRIRGMVTGTKTRVLHTNTFLFSANYYDRNGRSVQSKQTNITGGKDISTVQYAYSGLVLRSFLKHDKQGNNAKQFTVLSKYEYDHAGRALQLIKNFNGQGDKVVSTNTYNEIGVLKQKKVGDDIETQDYQFNIRGWITGINKDFVTNSQPAIPGTNGARYFGEIVSYDSGYARPLYNGNISGIRWKAAGDRIARSYGFNYDNAGRLIYADFSQQNEGSTAWTKDQVDYTVSGLNYDANGNILSMSQRALKIGSSALVDSLNYEYFTNSNLLKKVTDAVPDQTPGHFRDTSITADDYAYDVNGNIVKDNNRRMHDAGGNSGAVYNILDKPDSITIANKSTTRYEYDAAGNLLRKRITVIEGNQTRNKEYLYIAGFVYLNDTLQYSLMEEGCVKRVMRRNFQTAEMYEVFDYQYYIKDRQGNIRTVLTEGRDTAFYQASMEPGLQSVEDALFSNVYSPVYTVDSKPTGFDQDTDNTKVSKLNASPGTNKKTGPSLVLKVMAGDRVQINAYSYYNTTAQQPNSGTNLLTELLSILPGAVIGNSGGKLDAANTAALSGALSPNVLQFLNNNRPYDNGRPRAYLNWILFDEQYKYVASNSGVMQVLSGTEKQALVAPEQLISKNGYLFVYVSNESPQDVYFDDLTVKHVIGPLVEEKSYYPFGLVMGAISSKAMLKDKTSYAYNAGSEWEENGVDYYYTFYRKYDAQIGRFSGIDIASEEYAGITPYQFGANNPVLFNDPFGDKLQLPEELYGSSSNPSMEDFGNDLSWERRDFEKEWRWLDGFKNMSSGGMSLGEMIDQICKTFDFNSGQVKSGILLDNIGLIVRNDKDSRNVYMLDPSNGTINYLGMLGGTIIIDALLDNLIEHSSSLVKGDAYRDQLHFAMLVKTGGFLDIKNNTKFIFGYSAFWDKATKNSTSYQYAGRTLFSQDVGNIHYGAIGRAAGFSENTLLKAGGVVQVLEGHSREEWRRWGTYGDQPRDRIYIKYGVFLYDFKLKYRL